jgi:hypothetical protein
VKHVQPYLSAQALGIEDWERDELIALMPKLMAETIPIDMHQAASDCGTVCCIGGHIALSHGVSIPGARRYVQGNGPLEDLFFPDRTINFQHKGWRASAPQASQAILNFLTTGKPNWDAVMAGSQSGAAH